MRPPKQKARGLPPEQVLGYFLSDLEELELYMSFLQRWQSEEFQRYQLHIKRNDSDDDGNSAHEHERYGFRSDHFARLQSLFPQIGRHMLVVYIFSALEDSLNEFCFALQRTIPLVHSVLDTNGPALERARDYLRRTNVGFPADAGFWSSIKSAQKTRNMLTHSLGYLNAEPSTHKFVQQYLEKGGRGSVQRYARDQLQVNDKFIAELFTNIRKLYNWLWDSYIKAYPKPTRAEKPTDS